MPPPLGAPLHQLRKASERNNGLGDRFRANLPAGTGEDFAADALYLPHALPHPHHAHARALHSAPAETAGIVAGGLPQQSFGAIEPGQDRAHFV